MTPPADKTDRLTELREHIDAQIGGLVPRVWFFWASAIHVMAVGSIVAAMTLNVFWGRDVQASLSKHIEVQAAMDKARDDAIIALAKVTDRDVMVTKTAMEKLQAQMDVVVINQNSVMQSLRQILALHEKESKP